MQYEGECVALMDPSAPHTRDSDVPTPPRVSATSAGRQETCTVTDAEGFLVPSEVFPGERDLEG